ncbi:hypothetical protein ACFYZ9_30920 [Streptomyces sp. NPDC001691]|uniref:hypothetical protein n=1 Tax=Streptomyces sp. NPDC001691 TaxID=3364600 RepID=UPI0036AA6F9D
MRPWTTAFVVALRLTLLGHVHNRLAVLMAVVFIPGWVWIGGASLSHTPLTFRLDVLDVQVVSDVSKATQITSSLPGAATVIGFMMFMTTFKAQEMDQRLVLAGYPRTALTLARFTAMIAVAALLAVQITVVLRLTVGAPQPGMLWLAGWAAALAYGGIGTLLGASLRSELSGLFVVIACIFVELTLQNPLTNPRADQPWLVLLPLFGPSQTTAAAAFTRTGPGLSYAALGVLWCLVTSGAAAVVLAVRTRGCSPVTSPTGRSPRLSSPHAAVETGYSPARTRRASETT